ncbi:Chromosome partition protein smc [hydrothermal vent metagenome]|uniref:Chromosome partition protein smc n=1 Tax=hydrothermal vent metagenome TaxID=652676 RepID=A0A3B0WR66_9ZZZZ
MRLSKIKLSGFKSFVDPTTINFPSNLTGIVGPNGCGKSNTIDAVRWVMGESSAKHLRGASMDDVIFNGSSSRKPIDMASVELIFDNSEGKLGGQYANYAEISVKRQVARDGASKYSLNGTRCRKRDVADLFLGTGLGPRSYAIIEQGMISRLIEAKPEELRNFLEEAAGISKYKERRRETETRIRHTRENLERLSDLREEIEKQLAKLQRQSRSAERYKELKQEERELKAEHLTLHWRELKTELDTHDKEIQSTETSLESVIAEQRATESKIESHRQENENSNEILNNVQAEYYRLGAEISAKEQSIKHQQDLLQRQQTDLEQIQTALMDAGQAIQSDKQAIEEFQQNLIDEEPKLETLKAQEKESTELFQQAEQAMQTWQQTWDEINQRYSAESQKAQVERSRMEQLERHVEQQKQRLQKVDVEKQALRGENLEEQISDLNTLLVKSSDEKEEHEQKLTSAITTIKTAREKIVSVEQQSADVRRSIHQCQGSLSSMEALQEAALGKTDKAAQQWLEKGGINKNARFAEQLDVTDGWELAVETVLGDTLEAICVENIDQFSSAFDSLQDSNLSLIEIGKTADTSTASAVHLIAKVKSSIDLTQFLHGIRCTENLDDALQMRQSLSHDESIVTKDGIWLGANWLRISRDNDASTGVLARENSIRERQQELSGYEEKAETVSVELKELRDTLQSNEQQREEIQVALNTIHSRLNEIKAQISARESRHEHITNRGKDLDVELDEIQKLISRDEEEITVATRSRNEALENAEKMEADRKDLQGQRDDLQQQLQQHRSNLQQHREQAHQLAINVESLKTRLSGLQHNIQRMEQAQTAQLQRKQELESLLSQSAQPTEQLETELKALLEKRLISEEALAEARRKVESITQALRMLEQQRGEFEQRSQNVRGQLEKLRLDSQEIRVRSKTTLEQLEETGFELEATLETLSKCEEENGQASSKQWEAKLAEVASKISRLGPINLAAIEEYKEQLQRKEYLDEQDKDVRAALEILEQAIAKIDKETKTRFKDTFDHVNSRIKDMFPRLFGGGTAFLEMTGDDLLSTGVTIMARPPGKRISNIHLMSGGEKALTAVALVFAIFELNPAPFCMLDEVDAPLDEANVGRFCQLVKEMSSRVQFIFITHNKTTMEISEHLSGVTMRESGVSRLVSVDVAEAATMAGVGA